jgi:hypothetical protein
MYAHPREEGKTTSNLLVSGSSLSLPPFIPWQHPLQRLLTEDIDLPFPISQTSDSLWVPQPDTGPRASWERSGPRSASQWRLLRQELTQSPCWWAIRWHVALVILFYLTAWKFLCVCWTHLDVPVFSHWSSAAMNDVSKGSHMLNDPECSMHTALRLTSSVPGWLTMHLAWEDTGVGDGRPSTRSDSIRACQEHFELERII